MEISVNLMRQLDKVSPDLREVLYAILEEIERQSQERVTKSEFQELKQAVQELAQAQARTEARMETLAQRMEELAQAQARTEARMDSLSQRMEELAQAQVKTEAEVRKLAKSHQQLQKQVGGLSDAVGYGIEDRLMPFIPDYARLEYGIEIESLERRNVEYKNGKFDEVNILATGRINGDKAYLLGECKARPGKKDADRFAAMLTRLAEVLDGTFFPLLIGYTFAPEVELYVAHKYPHIRLVKTYAVEMRAKGFRA